MIKTGPTSILLLLLLTGCNSDKYQLTVTYPKADGLTNYSTVTINGLQVGHIESIKLGEANEILATIIFDDIKQLSTDSKFILVKDFLGTASISIDKGATNDYFQSGQKVTGQFAERDDKTTGTSFNILESFLGNPTKQDSILIELRRLNSNLEKLLEKK
ncbi:MAG: MlaD family protein [Cyclobacteriaceae bacterium]|jgi:ABC-type transporter Mla subunit MlaD